MAEHHERRRVMHAPQDVFALVGDVRDYPSFIKFIQAMRVTGEREESAGVRTLAAEAMVGYKFVRERFATTVRLDAPAHRIDVSFLSGPFSALDNKWRFEALADGSTLVDFWIRYQFRNPILQSLVHANFGRATGFLINAFETRAHQRFARAGDPSVSLEALLAKPRAAE